jgi:NADH dehydrogenase
MKNVTSNSNLKKVIIVGGGFAGINLALGLLRDKGYHITLVDKNNYNYFPPLVYQVATSFLDPSSICYPFRKLFRNADLNFRLGEFLRVDPATKTCYLNDGQITYDYLVFANGSKSNFFGMENVQKHAIALKNIEDALRMRNTLLKTMEDACLITDPVERKKLLTVVVAGGGPTGVEVSGMLAEMKRYILAKDYPELAGTPGEIYIVDGGANLLAPMSDKSHQHSYDALAKLGVHIKLHTQVKDYDGDIVTLSDGGIIESRSLIWAAGVTVVPIDGIPATSIGAGKRIIVDEFNKVTDVDDIYAIGDICLQSTEPEYPRGHPQLAQVAIQHGRNLAKNLLAMAKGKALTPFKYFDKGEMAIIGRNKAVVDLFKHKVHISGFPALFIWLFIHLVSLVNYRNKLVTMYHWTGAYLSKDQSLRMIIRS